MLDKSKDLCYYNRAGWFRAGVAQSVEQLICNQQVGGSSPSTSSTANLIKYGGIPEWPKGTDCKSAVNDFGGSNPPSPTMKNDKFRQKLVVFSYIRLSASYMPFGA